MKSTSEIRNFLIQQMEAVASGMQGHNEAKAICNYSQQIYNTLNMELKHATMTKKLGEQDVKPVEFK